VKPENVLFSSGQACLADFGIARAIERAAGESTTETGVARGTPMYMSPEQAAADRIVDGRSDVYSLGCVFYEMLAGEAPFTGPTTQAIIARHMYEQPRELRIVRPSLPESIQFVVEKALAKAAADRYQTAAAFADALLHPPTRRAGRSRTMLRTGSRIAAVVVLLVTAVAVARLVGVFRRAPTAANTADPRRIAVLDFEDQSPSHNAAHIASGLTVGLIHELSGIPAIQVLSRNSAKAFREQALPFDSMVAALRIGSLVEGSLQRSNDRLRLTVHLVDATTKTQLESAAIERPLGELFMLEDDLAHQVALLLRHRIGIELRVRQTAAGTKDQRARESAFLADKLRDDAASLLATRDTADATTALALLNRADSVLMSAEIADHGWITPTINRGWVALELARHQNGPVRERAFSRAIEHADRALARSAQSASALELRGTVQYWQAALLDLADKEFNDRLTRSEADLRRALSLDTLLATAWGTLSLVRVARGEVTEAERAASAAFYMDAYLKDAPAVLFALYDANLMKGTLNESWKWCDVGSRDYPRDPRFIECKLTLLAEDESRRPDPKLAWSLVARGNQLDPPSRAATTGREYHPIYRSMMAAIVSARAGQTDSARAVARRARAGVENLRGLRTDLEYDDAYLSLVLGQRSEAIRLLSDYLTARPSLRGLVARHARWRRLESDSAFRRLIAGSQP
jgi:serine/threonine-protein kinase